MSMSDPISDMLTRIRNAQMSEKVSVAIPSSKVKVAIAKVLKDEGYIDDFAVRDAEGKAQLDIGLKYHAGEPVIETGILAPDFVTSQDSSRRRMSPCSMRRRSPVRMPE